MPEDLGVSGEVVNTDELSEQEMHDAEVAFASGFGSEPDANALNGSADPDPASRPSQESKPVVAAESAVAPVVEPVAEPVATMSDTQLKELLAKVNTVDDLRVAIDKLRGDAFGKVGGLERTLKQLQESTPIGQAIEVSASDLAELESEFPGLNLGPSLAKGLTRVLSKLKGTGAHGLTPEAVNEQIEARLQQEKVAREEERKQQAAERLTDLHEDWPTVIGPPNSQTEFRLWLKAQGADKELAFLNSWDPRFIGKTLTAFKAEKQAPKPKPTPTVDVPNRRNQRLAEAVPAKGGGVPPANPRKNDEEAAFEAGFASR